MIIVRFTSGLGNQMFQYNLYSLLRDRFPGTIVKADVTWFYTDDEHHGFELEKIFGSVPGSGFMLDKATTKEIYSVTGQFPTPVKGALARPIKFLLGPVNRKLREAGKCEKCGITYDHLVDKIDFEKINMIDPSVNHYIFGFFIEEAYYRDRIDRIKEELVFPALSGQNEEMAQRMRECDSVSVHVRRGDYLSSQYAGRFICLDRDYYEKAVNIVREKLDNPRFFFFCEDEEYIREEFSWLPDKTIVDFNKGSDSYRDMQLMTCCKANIIANSTFSQWASILNENTDHITVYPARYMADEDTEVKTMPGWIRI